MIKRLTLSVILLLAFAVSGRSKSEVSDLDSWYQAYNATLFNNELPHQITISHDLSDPRFMAVTDYDFAGRYYKISLNPKYEPSPKQGRATLLHEMCHLRQLVSGEVEFQDHGAKWQSCMHDLANKNAFEDIW